jgi:hypothetical protein
VPPQRILFDFSYFCFLPETLICLLESRYDPPVWVEMLVMMKVHKDPLVSTEMGAGHFAALA